MNNLYNKIYEAVDNGIQKALIINPAEDVSVKFHNKKISAEFIPYEYRIVDMGTDVLWTEYNLGAEPGNIPEDWYGDYYAWEKANSKNKYDENNYGYHIVKKLMPINDVVIQTLGNGYRMPTKDEYQQLIDNTTQEWIRNYNNVSGLNGMLFTSKNNKTLFFPATGLISGNTHQHYEAGESGCIWSASHYAGNNMNCLYFYSSGVRVHFNGRYGSLPVRGVYDSHKNN